MTIKFSKGLQTSLLDIEGYEKLLRPNKITFRYGFAFRFRIVQKVIFLRNLFLVDKLDQSQALPDHLGAEDCHHRNIGD